MTPYRIAYSIFNMHRDSKYWGPTGTLDTGIEWMRGHSTILYLHSGSVRPGPVPGRTRWKISCPQPLHLPAIQRRPTHLSRAAGTPSIISMAGLHLTICAQSVCVQRDVVLHDPPVAELLFGVSRSRRTTSGVAPACRMEGGAGAQGAGANLPQVSLYYVCPRKCFSRLHWYTDVAKDPRF